MPHSVKQKNTTARRKNRQNLVVSKLRIFLKKRMDYSGLSELNKLLRSRSYTKYVNIMILSKQLEIY